MRISTPVRYVVRRNALYVRSLDDRALDAFAKDVAMEPYKGPYMKTLGKLIEREIQRRIRRGTYDLWH